MDLTEPTDSFGMLQSRFFVNFTQRGFLGCFTFFDVTFWNCPAVFGILDQQDLDSPFHYDEKRYPRPLARELLLG